MERQPQKSPELQLPTDSTIISDVILASQYEAVPTEDEFEVLRRPLLGKNGYGEGLFHAFERDADNLGYRLKTLTIKVFPETGRKNTTARTALQSHESRYEENAIVFNDTLAGSEILLLHHQERGVLTFTFVDRHEDIDGLSESRAQNYTAPSVQLTFRDATKPKSNEIVGVANFYNQQGAQEHKFIPTSPAQLILLGIVHSILHSPKA